MPAGRPVEWTPERIKVLGEELLAHVKMPGVYTIASFAIEKEFTEEAIYNIADRHEQFREYLTRAKDILAKRLIELGVEKGLDNFYYNYMIPMHSSSVNRHRKLLRQEEIDKIKEVEKYKKELGSTDYAAEKSAETNELITDLQKEIRQLKAKLAERGDAHSET